MTKTAKNTARAESLEQLRKLLPEGATVYTVLRSVAKSGMSRRIDLYTVVGGELRFLSGYVGEVLGYKRGKGDGLTVGGCGMDMGYHLVHSLSQAMFGDGYKLEHRWI